MTEDDVRRIACEEIERWKAEESRRLGAVVRQFREESLRLNAPSPKDGRVLAETKRILREGLR